MSLPRTTIAAVFLLLGCSFASADNWPQWRGANLDGKSSETNLPKSWSRESNIAWRLPLPGAAGATPVVWEKQVFLTSIAKDNLILICVGTNGKEQWRQTIATGNKNVRGDEGNSAAPSPCTDGKYVWALFANGRIGCYTVDGKEVWKLNLEDRYGKFRNAFGMTSTPVLDGDKLYLQLIHGEGNPQTREAIIVALDKTTGDEIWKHDRKSDARAECEHSYASPTLYRDDEREFLVSHGADYVVAHDLKDGSELWRCGDLNPKGGYNATLRFVSSPLAVAGMIVVPSAKNGPVFCLNPDIKGDVTNQDSAFQWKRLQGTPDVPSPLAHAGIVYLCRENGNLVAVDAKTGESYYEERTTRDRHRASPVYADGHLYLTARNGVITVVKTGKEFEIVSQNDLGEGTAASPVISNGRIYVRTFDALYAIGK